MLRGFFVKLSGLLVEGTLGTKSAVPDVTFFYAAHRVLTHTEHANLSPGQATGGRPVSSTSRLFVWRQTGKDRWHRARMPAPPARLPPSGRCHRPMESSPHPYLR